MCVFSDQVAGAVAGGFRCPERIEIRLGPIGEITRNEIHLMFDGPVHDLRIVYDPECRFHADLVHAVDQFGPVHKHIYAVRELESLLFRNIGIDGRPKRIGNIQRLVLRGQASEFPAGMLAERGEFHLVQHIQLLAEHHDFLDDSGFDLGRFVFLQFQNQLRFGNLPALVQKFAERRYPVAARQYEPADFRIRVLLGVEPVADFRAVDDDQLAVGCSVDVEFHTVDT